MGVSGGQPLGFDWPRQAGNLGTGKRCPSVSTSPPRASSQSIRFPIHTVLTGTDQATPIKYSAADYENPPIQHCAFHKNSNLNRQHPDSLGSTTSPAPL